VQAPSPEGVLVWQMVSVGHWGKANEAVKKG
jgi:hypothetical protein